MNEKKQDYYVNIKWMTIVLPVLGIAIFEVFRFQIFQYLFDSLTNSFILMVLVGSFGYLFSTWLFKKIQGIHNTLFWEQQRLKSIFTYTSDGIIVLGEDFKILDINPAAEKLTGWKYQEVVGKKTCDEMNRCSLSKELCWNSTNPDSCMNVDCGHRECWGKTCLEKKISIPYVEMCLMRKNGKRIKVAASYSYIPSIGDEKPQVKLVLRDISERKELEKDILNYATLEERYRLAREMHDGLAQTLAFLNIKARNIQKKVEKKDIEHALEDLKEFRQVTQQAVAEVRENIFNLKTPPREETSCFRVWIKDYLNSFGSLNNLETEFCCDFKEPIVIPTEAKIHLIRIIQEALTNIRKHAQATKIKINIYKNEDKIIFSIKDNGVGINFAELKNIKRNHFGLTIMKERAQLIGGELRIKNNYPQGTIVEIELSGHKENLRGEKIGESESFIS